MEHLKTFEAAAISLGKDPNILPQVEGIDEGHAKALTAVYKLFIISEAAWKAEDKKIDWNDFGQYKYYPWFDMENSSGSPSGFSFNVFGYDFAYSSVGSRLVFPSREIARYVGQTHLELYKDLMVIQ
ncbi:hypothetical protein [Emticicia sp. BO119]|uniref:hypothetical protein n=1 Tax=Emticicia sp. BO119 TaxID=2757768 RepID=UPI0015F0D52F|nr:hypothetical protein [Emticicia sp. BO119]MBA4852040.1 hypothetical protein [Emticicia sp. BO119]